MLNLDKDLLITDMTEMLAACLVYQDGRPFRCRMANDTSARKALRGLLKLLENDQNLGHLLCTDRSRLGIM